MSKNKKKSLSSSQKASGIAALVPAFTAKTFDKLREEGKGPPFILKDGEAYYEWKDYRLWFKNTVIPLVSGDKVDIYTGKLIVQKEKKTVENRGGANQLTEPQPVSFADEQVFSSYLQGTLHQTADLTTRQVAMVMRVSLKTVENMRTHNTGPKSFKVSGGRILYKFGHLQNYLNSLTFTVSNMDVTPGYGPSNGKDEDLFPIGIEG